VINTHFHGDHTFGNYVFEPAAIIAAEQVRADMTASGLHLTGLWPDVDWGELRLTLPDVLFTNRMTLFLGETRVELLDVGPAHTTSDTVVWLPEQRVLFTGDVVMSGVTPFLPMGSVTGTLAALDRMRALAPATVVTGHGVLAGPEVFDELSGYLHWLLETARAGIAAGLAPLAAAREVKLGDYADWLESVRLVPNLHRAYADELGTAGGTGVDLLAAFGEMVEFHGGPLPCHA
jgi:cyclase